MTRMRMRGWQGTVPRTVGLALAAWALLLTQTGCVAVGYRSGGGWFVWPGGLGLVVMVLLVLFLLRRR